MLLVWDGLGYNRRAVALSDAARAIVRDHAGRVPADPTSLRALPGVGPYTAAAVASIAFGVPIAAIDTNVRRIVLECSRRWTTWASRARQLADAWLDPRDPGAWNQALMDLGRGVCRPQPRCDVCPLGHSCAFLARGVRSSIPRRSQAPFEGSLRQVRGAVVRALRARNAATADELAGVTGFDAERVGEAVRRLIAEGLLEARGARVRLDR